MANELRLRTNLAAGAITTALTTSDTTLASAGLADLGVIDATNHAAITLFLVDSNGRVTAKEIVYVTAHTAAASTATIVRAREGTTAAAWAIGSTWANGATTKEFDGAAGGSGLIGLTVYNPVSVATVAVTSTSFSDLDATNLVVAFTAPPSGRVLVRLTARANASSSSELSWNLREASADLAGTAAVVAYTSGSQGNRVCHTAYVSGLVAGAAKSYKWGAARTFGSGTTDNQWGGTPGAAVMEVWAVNL